MLSQYNRSALSSRRQELIEQLNAEKLQIKALKNSIEEIMSELIKVNNNLCD